MINHVEEILNRAKEIHLKKRADYASDPNTDPFENFDRSNLVALWFPDSYKSFAVLIGTKLARLGSLLISGRTPNNESIDDSFLDLVTYCALFYGYWKSKQIKAQSEAIDKELTRRAQVLVLQMEPCNVHDKYDGHCEDCRNVNRNA